jgi:hypothetical protein
MNFIGMDSIILLFVRQDRKDCQDIFCHHQFPGLPRHSSDSSGRRREEIDDTTPMKWTKYFIGQTIHLRWNQEFNGGQYCFI